MTNPNSHKDTAKPARPKPPITLNHWSNFAVQVIPPLPLDVMLYHCGNLPPNYPVPAIPLAVAIHSYCVQIAEAYWFEGDWEFDLVAEFELDEELTPADLAEAAEKY